MREAATVGSLDERGGDMQRNGATELRPFLGLPLLGLLRLPRYRATDPAAERLEFHSKLLGGEHLATIELFVCPRRVTPLQLAKGDDLSREPHATGDGSTDGGRLVLRRDHRRSSEKNRPLD